VGDDVLNEELSQLGLPTEIANSITRAYIENREAIRANLLQKFLPMTRVTGVEWRVDHILASSYPTQPVVGLKLATTSGNVNLETTPTHLMILTQELKKARDIMDGLELEETTN
jgi:hypothetical protein